MAKRRPKKQPSPRRKRREPVVVRLLEYEITYDPIVEPAQARLPADVQEEIGQLHSLSQSQPEEAVPRLLDLIERYPDVSVLRNFLAVAYSVMGQEEKSEEVIMEHLRLQPDYLFARLNYAEICLSKGRYDEFAEVLDHKFDLKLLYPNRDRFHISEFVSFSTIVGSYFAARGEREVAERYLDLLREMEPDHPMTARLRSRIERAELVQGLERLRGLLPGRRRSKPDSER